MISQIDLISVIVKHLDKCGIKTMVPRQYNAVIQAVNMIIDELEERVRRATPGMGFDAWLRSDDTGVSSEFMAGVLSRRFMRKYGHPHDGDDFGRCVRLLDAAPELRANLDSIKSFSPEWNALVTHWDEFEALYRSGGEGFYQRLQDAYEKARVKP
jgi:hypothetical protein